jgi:hypothetical protein
MIEYAVRLRNTAQPWESSVLFYFVGSTAERDAHRAAVEFCGGHFTGVRAAARFLRTAKPFENATVDITCAQTV